MSENYSDELLGRYQEEVRKEYKTLDVTKFNSASASLATLIWRDNARFKYIESMAVIEENNCLLEILDNILLYADLLAIKGG